MKPSDFYIGIVDIIGIMLPGGLLALLFSDAARTHIFNGSLMPMLTDEKANVAALLVAAFLLGKGADAVGSVAFDWLTDKTYRAWKVGKHAGLITKAGQVREKQLGKEHADMVSDFRWARVSARERSPQGILAVERLEADAKLFRGLTIVFLVAALKLFVSGQVLPGFIATGLALLALARCSVQRWQRDKTALEHFVARETLVPGT